jgi:hypothetical protein
VQFEVLVTDNGQPPLSASIQFLVTVRPRPTLELRPAQPGWELHWTEGTLQEADTVTGPWRDIPTPPPYRMPLNETQKFYRIRVTP